MFDKLYILNGTMFLVSDSPETIPNRTLMVSSGISIENGPMEEAKRLPTDMDMTIISTSQARQLFGTGANVFDGVSVRLRLTLSL